MGKFKVISAPEFIASGPAFGSREEKLAIEAELVARDVRLAEQQRSRDRYDARREQQTPIERVYSDLEILCETQEQSPDINFGLRHAIAETWRSIEELE